MKVRTYGALMGALLSISAIETAEAATCTCESPPKVHHIVRHAPAPVIHRTMGADADYAQSYYDYRSSSRVREAFVRRAGMARDGWRVAPNDARIRFYRDERVVYVPTAMAYPPPPPGYYGGYDQGYGPAYGPGYDEGLELDNREFQGGIGYNPEGGGGGGGGYGGQAFLYQGGVGGQAEPSNGGGVDLPGGYGRDYHGNWQGYVPPGQMTKPSGGGSSK